jgi:hypothetical protein
VPSRVLIFFASYQSTLRANCIWRAVADVLVIVPAICIAKEKERSAAPPSGEGAAALLGVLASWFEGSLRNCWRWELFARVRCEAWPLASAQIFSILDSLLIRAVCFPVETLRFGF